MESVILKQDEIQISPDEMDTGIENFDFRSIEESHRLTGEGTSSTDEKVTGMRKGKLRDIFIIKPYQRGYRWNENNAEKLFDDIKKYTTSKSFKEIKDYINPLNGTFPGKFDFYCLQTLTVKDLGSSEQGNVYELIDGQQRLTTLFLLYELLNIFLNGYRLEDREDYPYIIKYDRGNGNQFDLTEYLHNKFPADFSLVDYQGAAPKKVLLPSFSGDKEKWFDCYKAEIRKEMQLSQAEIAAGGASLTIDIHYIIRVLFAFLDYIRINSISEQTLTDVYNCIKYNVFFLWYELASSINAKAKFNTLNSNQIKLTNAELIKSLTLRLDACQGETIEQREIARNKASEKWEGIEQRLNDNNLWAFISGEDSPTRIELVLELAARVDNADPYVPKYQSKEVSSEQNELFDYYEKRYMEKHSAFSEWSINSAEKVFDRICEWYDDVEIYHYVGLLTKYQDLFGIANSQEELLFKCYQAHETECVDRNEFIAYLKKMIREAIIDNAGLPKDQIKQGATTDIDSLINCEKLSYQDQSSLIEAILWLINVNNVINASENKVENDEASRKVMNRRLPFSKINNRKVEWSIEHIMPQDPKDAKDPSKEVQEKYEDFMNKLTEYKKTVGAGIILNPQDVHWLPNLTLLTKGDNSAFSNKNLEEKCEVLVDKIGAGSFIPPATINAFMLYYSIGEGKKKITSNDRKYWTVADSTQYIAAIKDILKEY